MPDSLVDRVDSLLGDGIETAVRTKHRLRLRRLGWQHALKPVGDGLWAHGDPPPRSGCSLDLLLDGAHALPEMARALAGAREFIHITGWHIEPSLELVRGDVPVVLGLLLAELAERVDVRVMVWAGAPVPAFHPTRREVLKTVHNLVTGTRIQCKPDPREHPFHCHHEKTIVIDGELAFVGGIDLTNAGGDRFDSQAHHARRSLGWHDAAARLQGPAVADVDQHFRLRWEELTGEQLPAAPSPQPLGGQTVQVVRTIANGMYDRVPHGDFRILESYTRALRSARHLIYIENQFLWSTEIVAILADKLRHPPQPDFRLVLLLPAKPNNGSDDTRGQLGVLGAADAGAGRLLAVTVRALSEGRADPLYVHAKVAVVDDRWLTVGSANLNAHSLFNDTEMNLVTEDPELAHQLRVRLWAEHLQLDEATVASCDPHVLVDERWRPIAQKQLARRDAGEPPTHRLLALPGVSRRSRRLLGPLQGLIDDG
ncbi:MAG: phospholipase D family protein [Actinomycetota bacterium]|nr:phospholipase D family protein [Actinomycetota bacterium]